MKKEYKKPVVILESFALATSVAAGCEVQTNTSSYNQCGVEFSGINVFMTNMTGCEGFEVEEEGGDGEFNGLCYHVPIGSQNLFNS